MPPLPDGLWRRRAWGRPVSTRPARPPWFEVAAVLLVASYNPVTNLLVPDVAYVPSNLLAAGLLVALAIHSGASWDHLGLRPDRLRKGLAVGLAVAGVIVALVVLATAVPATRTYFADDRLIGDPPAEMLYETLVRIPLGTALAEETIFRAVLLGMFLRWMSPLAAATTSSVVFGLWHILPTLAGLETNPAGDLVSAGPAVAGAVAAAVVVTTAAGYAFCWIRFRANSVVAAVIAHLAVNSAAFAAGWTVVRQGWA